MRRRRFRPTSDCDSSIWSWWIRTISARTRVTGPVVAAGALWVGNTRLIDNVRCTPRSHALHMKPASCVDGDDSSVCWQIAGRWCPRAARTRPLEHDEQGPHAVAGIKVGHFTLSERPTGCTVVVVEAKAPSAASRSAVAHRHARDRSARSAQHGGPGQRHCPVGRQRLRARRGAGRHALSRGEEGRLESRAAPWCRSCRRRSSSTSGSAATRRSARQLIAAKGRRRATNGRSLKATSVRAPVRRSASRWPRPGHESRRRFAAIALPNGLVVGALVAVNAAGDIVDPGTGSVVAGVRTEDGKRSPMRAC